MKCIQFIGLVLLLTSCNSSTNTADEYACKDVYDGMPIERFSFNKLPMVTNRDSMVNVFGEAYTESQRVIGKDTTHSIFYKIYGSELVFDVFNDDCVVFSHAIFQKDSDFELQTNFATLSSSLKIDFFKLIFPKSYQCIETWSSGNKNLYIIVEGRNEMDHALTMEFLDNMLIAISYDYIPPLVLACKLK